MDVALFDFDLPGELIAQKPAPRRDASRLLRYDRESGKVSHHRFAELPELLPAGVRMFRNNAAVLKARLRGHLPTGGKVECLLLHPEKDEPERWQCLLKPGRKLNPGATFGLAGEYQAKVEARGDGGTFTVRITPDHAEPVTALAGRIGESPLPPYITREDSEEDRKADEERYQTVYADPARPVAAAAPTAGLHFTPELLARLASDCVPFYDLTLHVGLGTFKPITEEAVEAHAIHKEFYELPAKTAAAAEDASGGPRLAIGTTCVRSLEDFARLEPGIRGKARREGYSGEADIYLYPPAAFQRVDALITNFHLPRSTLLCLVSAFLSPGQTDGIERLHDLYRHAIRERYRFYSYGDAMLIL